MFYFAYGSNMNQERMKERDAGFKDAQKAYINDYRLRFNKISDKNPGEGFANIEPQRGFLVEGVLYKVDEKSLENLDRFENFPTAYRRELFAVKGYEFEVIDAHVYIANKTHVAENLLPSKYYINHLLKARDYLSDNYYNFLLNHPTL